MILQLHIGFLVAMGRIRTSVLQLMRLARWPLLYPAIYRFNFFANIQTIFQRAKYFNKKIGLGVRRPSVVFSLYFQSILLLKHTNKNECSLFLTLSRWWDSNPHARYRHQSLNLAGLPIPPHPEVM